MIDLTLLRKQSICVGKSLSFVDLKIRLVCLFNPNIIFAGVPKPIVTWFRDGKMLKHGSACRIYDHKDEYFLEIPGYVRVVPAPRRLIWRRMWDFILFLNKSLKNIHST